jgi:hypothetical protein
MINEGPAIGENENCLRKPMYYNRTHPSATLFSTNLTKPGMGTNPGFCREKPATNYLKYGKAEYRSSSCENSEYFVLLLT